MLLSLLLRPSLCPPHAALLSRSVHSVLLRRRLPVNLQSRGAKSGGGGRRSRGREDDWGTRNKTVLTYIAAAGVGMIGLSYAAVPLYRLYCQVRKHLRLLVLS